MGSGGDIVLDLEYFFSVEEIETSIQYSCEDYVRNLEASQSTLSGHGFMFIVSPKRMPFSVLRFARLQDLHFVD